MSTEPEWPWEASASRNEPLPDGLSLEDQSAYLAMRALYQSYRSGKLTKEQGRVEKRKVAVSYRKRVEAREFADRLTAHHVAMWKATEEARGEARLNPSMAALDRLIKAVDGVDSRWEEGNQWKEDSR